MFDAIFSEEPFKHMNPQEFEKYYDWLMKYGHIATMSEGEIMKKYG